MKPRDEHEGVAMNKTSKDLSYPNMPQDEPERVKNLNKDASSWAKVLPTAVLTGSAQQALSVLTMALADIQKLSKALSVSEKRAEEAEARAKFDRETLQARETLGGALGMDMNECVVEATKRVCKQYERERDEAREAHKLMGVSMAIAISERNSSQASLLRVVEEIDWLFGTENAYRGKPRLLDLCYTVFLRAKGTNDEDGGPTDWFNDTLPEVVKLIAKLRTALSPHTEK